MNFIVGAWMSCINKISITALMEDLVNLLYLMSLQNMSVYMTRVQVSARWRFDETKLVLVDSCTHVFSYASGLIILSNVKIK